MQLIGRTSSKGTAYTQAQVLAQLFGPVVAEQWVFDWLYPDGRYQGDFTPFIDDQVAPRIAHDTTMQVKRTLSFNIRSSGLAINPLQDLVRVHYQLLMPDGGWIDYIVGTFALLPPRKEIKVKTNQTFLAADLSQLLVDGSFLNTYSLPRGNTVGTAVSNIVGSLRGPFTFQYAIPDQGKTLTVDLVWEAGTTRLQALNNIMAAFNYAPIFADEMGILRSYPLPDWSIVLPYYTFDLMNTSAGKIPIAEEKDLSMAFNQQTVIVEKTAPVQTQYAVTAYNTSPLSEVSIPRWHAKAGPIIRDSKIVDAITAFSRAQYAIQQAARIYNPVTVQTLPWPVSQDLDLYGLFYNTADEGVQFNQFLELSWSMECAPGGTTQHVLQKVLPTS